MNPPMLPLVKEVVTQHDSWHRKQTSNPEGEEDEPRLLRGKVVKCLEDVRKGSNEGEQHAEVEGDVDAYEEDDGLSEEHVHWPEEGNR